MTPHPQKPLIPRVGEGLRFPSAINAGPWMGSVLHRSCVHNTASEFMMRQCCQVLETTFHSLPPHPPLSHDAPWALQRSDGDIHVCPVWGWALTVTHLNQLWISTLNTTFCRNELLQSRLRVALTAGYKHRYLEGRFTACLFSKATVIDSPLRAHGLHEFSLKGKLVKILLSLVKR